jgi:hypothetical protein
VAGGELEPAVGGELEPVVGGELELVVGGELEPVAGGVLEPVVGGVLDPVSDPGSKKNCAEAFPRASFCNDLAYRWQSAVLALGQLSPPRRDTDPLTSWLTGSSPVPFHRTPKTHSCELLALSCKPAHAGLELPCAQSAGLVTVNGPVTATPVTITTIPEGIELCARKLTSKHPCLPVDPPSGPALPVGRDGRDIECASLVGFCGGSRPVLSADGLAVLRGDADSA